MKYQLIKKVERTGHIGDKVNYVEWNDKGYLINVHEDIQVGRSLVLDLGIAGMYQWMTTPIVSIENTTPKSISFTTKNSQYKLTWK